MTASPRFPPRLAAAALLLAGLGLVSPGVAEESAWYLVRPGDNLTRIAVRLGVSVADLQRDNGLLSDVIHPGQKLVIARPYSRGDAQITWQRPVERLGRLLRDFGPYKNDVGATMPRHGVDLAARVGTAVTAPAHGVCRYAGVVEGFGTVVILEHAGGYSTVLAPLDPASLAVAAGQAIWRGEFVGRTGPPVEGDDPYLHVQLRRKERAIRPTPLLR